MLGIKKWKKNLAFILSAALIAAMAFTPAEAATAAPSDTGFVTATGNYFTLDGQPFYYSGSNNYYLNYTSDKMIDDVLNSAKQMNLKVMRCWGFIDGEAHNGYVMQPSLGVYDDDSGFERLDYTINKASELGIKLIIPFVNNWDDFGGMDQYVAWTGAGSHDAFFTNAACRTAYKNYVSHMLNHVNVYSGIAYKDDPTVMAWELANEPRCQSDPTGNTLLAWADEMSTYIKSIDQNHLVTVGDEGFFNRGGSDFCYNGGSGVDWDRLIELPNIDFETMHLYPEGWGKTIDWSVQYINDHIATAKSVGKPVILEEYGVTSNQEQVYSQFGDAVYGDAAVGDGAAGNMFWLLTGINDDGSLYPNYDGFRVTYPSDVASVLSSYADLMNAKSAGVTVSNSTISPTSATFDKNPENSADVTVAVSLNGNEFRGIYNGTTALVPGTDYTVGADGSVTILSSYLASQITGTYNLRFDFSAGTDPVLDLTVVDSSAAPPPPSGSVRVQMFNATQGTSNSIMPRFRIYNTGSAPIALSDVKLRYYYTENGTGSQNIWCDWSSVGSGNVTGTFITPSLAAAGADTILEIGFAPGAGSLAPGASIEVQTRFAKVDWSNYTQSDDYSFDPTDNSYADWSKVTAYVNGTLVWGSEP